MDYQNLHEWQLAHIQKGVEAARKGDFASDKGVKDFFDKHGESMRLTDSFPLLEEHESKVQALRSALIEGEESGSARKFEVDKFLSSVKKRKRNG